MQKTILIFSLSRSPWIGGIYYRKNIINLLLNSSTISNKYKIVLLVNEQHKEIFKCYENLICIESCKNDVGIFGAAFIALKCCIKYHVKYVFPIKGSLVFKMLRITPVSWIADFQHCYYPEFFTDKEIKQRNHNFSKMAKKNNPLILSSYAAEKDFKRFYKEKRKNLFVVHFASAISDELERVKNSDETKIMEKYGVKKNDYFIVCNQFWQHKNHEIVLKALKLLKSEYGFSINIAFTGELNDRRCPDYIFRIKELMSDCSIKDNIFLLGFIERMEQLVLIKNAKAVIQPSLFEGWGTVVEDSKALNKQIIMSDIDVHKEQKDANCILFKKNDEKDLAEKILLLEKKEMNQKTSNELYENCINEYTKEIEKVFG